LAFLGTALSAWAQVIINEIHYHPVELETFNADGTPALDLTDDVHEFIEIRNTGAATVDLSGWRLTDGVSYTFPASTTIPAGGFKVIAKNAARLQTVYGITGVLGPYSGVLSNGSDTIKLKDATGTTIDSVSYSDSFPWPSSADALGANNDFLGFAVTPYQYKGRSLQRVSPTAGSNDPANWLASPLSPGPTPGSANAVTLATPRPVVVALTAVQASNESPVIRSGQAVTVTATFSSTVSLSNVQLEWWVDNIEVFNETRTTIAMNAIGNGQYVTATAIPGQADRSIVRYRIKADRGIGLENVSPRADDMAIVPVSATTKEAWHSYFVQPVRSSTRPIYDFFISTANDNQLNTNISQSPRRVTAPDPPGYPRDEPFDGYYPANNNYNPANYPAAGQPMWDGLVPAIFVKDGIVHDILCRYHGSRYQRAQNKNSWKFFFPSSRLMDKKQRFLVTEKTNATVLGFALFREANLLAAHAQFVDFYRNNLAVTTRCEIGDMDEETINRYQEEQIALNPQAPPTFGNLGLCYKAKGLDGDEGPYGWANGQPMPVRNVWSVLDRYIHSFPIQNDDWKGQTPFKTMLDALWSARGDGGLLSYNQTYNGQNHGNQTAVSANLTNLRAYLNANWDVDDALTYLAVRNWCSPWDDKFHNYYVYQKPNGRWTMLPWDFDNEMDGSDPNTAAPTNSIFAGRKNDTAGTYSNNSRGPNWFKDSLLRAFETEFKNKLFILNNTLLTPSNVTAIAAAYGTTVPNASWLTQRQSSINSQLGLGPWYAPTTATHTSPANGASVLPPASLTTSAYGHTNPSPRAHAATLWEIREASGSYRTPIYRVKSTTNLTSLPIPFELLNFGTTYFWRATRFDVDDRPSAASAETSFVFGPTPTTSMLITMDAVTNWKYNQTDQFNNTNSGPADPLWWASTAYNDTGANWLSGPAPIGLNPNTTPPIAIRTPLTLNSRPTFYFRKTFNFPGSPVGATVRLRHYIDDGCVIYINGVELPNSFRFNMPAQPAAIDYSTVATGTVSTASLSSYLNVPASYFVQGTNVIAVEVHQNSVSSSDVMFGIEIEATIPFSAGDIAINELLADNGQAVVNGGRNPDYVELYNNTFSNVDISGWGLTDDVLNPTKYVFPAGTIVPAQGYLTVWCDSDFTAPGLHTGFGLSANGQTVALIQGTSTIKDFVQFGPQARDVALGRVSNGTGAFTAVAPSPGAANTALPLGPTSTLKINEWLSSPNTGDDWFELYNPSANVVPIGGLYLSDTPSSPTITQIPPLSFIGGKGFTRFLADGSSEGGHHCNFRLSASGDSLVLTASNGTTTIDSLSFGALATGASQGRLPDGATGAFVTFTQSQSPGASNWLPAAVVINEALASSAAPFEDAIELHNPTGAAVNIGGWWLSDDTSNLQKYQIPAGTTVAAGGYRVFYENQFNTGVNAFALSSLGDELYLSAVDGGGALTGYRSQVRFGASAANVSFGRVLTGNPAGSYYPEFWPQTTRTFGQDNAATVEQFRTGTGLANGAPRTGPIIIHEIMYHPPDGSGGTDNARDEFIELHNITTSAVDVSGWRLKGDSDYTFPAGTSIRPGDYVLLVSFNPNDNATLTAFRTLYGLGTGTRIYGPYSPKLANSTQNLEFAYPDAGGPLINIEKVEYTDYAPWPPAADGTGASLQRASRTIIGNDPANYAGLAPTPGAVNTGQASILDNDGDGMSNAYEDAQGFDKFDAADAAQDADGDGLSNLAESLAGTDPRNAASVLRASVAKIAGGFRISFPAIAGKNYTIQYRDSLATGAWLRLVDIPTQGSSGTVIHDDLTAVTQRFYRVVTPQQ
jgi:hypothetical protein